MSEVNDDLILLYVAGACDADETERAEALLSAAGPVAAAMMAEAVSVFHAVPFGLTSIEPPSHCRHTLLGRVTADMSSHSQTSSGLSIGLVSRLRWPLYVSSGLAACLAVALTLSLSNGRQMAAQLAVMSDRDAAMSNTLTTAREVMASPKLTLANLTTQEPSAASPQLPPMLAPPITQTSKPFGRVMFCPISRRYTFGVFNMGQLPDDRKYEMWLIADNRPPVPAALFSIGPDGGAIVVAQVGPSTETFKKVAITDEPLNGSTKPTGRVHLAGNLPQ